MPKLSGAHKNTSSHRKLFESFELPSIKEHSKPSNVAVVNILQYEVPFFRPTPFNPYASSSVGARYGYSEELPSTFQLNEFQDKF